MDYLEIDAKVGEVDLRSLGNARYKDADINAGIGELTADFHGAMESDSHTRIDLDIGETTVILPADIAVRLSVGGMFSFLSEKNITGSLFRRGRFYYSENYDASQTRCAFTVTPGLGQLDIQRQP
jgi:predicted membrane protein